MCGFAGAFSLDGRGQPSRRVVEEMTRALAHRGPDATGYHTSASAVLGHQRLSILDVSIAAAQPMVSASGRYVLAFNGEIYNYRELREELRLAGAEFRSHSDTEVVLTLYEALGSDCVRRLEGMFALAVLDTHARTLFLARDRAGEKPLYYTRWEGTLYFASEIKALWKVPGLPRRLNQAAVVAHFTHTQTPPPGSIYKGIAKVVPGFTVQFDQSGGEKTASYWHLDYTRKFTGSFLDAVEELNATLSRTVENTTVSDRRVGIMLSGGVDSSITLAHMRGLTRQPVLSFSFGGPCPQEEDLDLRRAGQLADWHGTEHHTYAFGEASFGAMRRALRHFDEPIGVYDSVFAYYHAKAISPRCQVLLTGSGADEVFGGYPSYLDYCASQGGIYEWRLPKAEIDRTLSEEFNRRAREDAELLYAGATEQFAREVDALDQLEALFQLADYDRLLDGKLFIELMAGMSHCASLFDITGMAHGVEYRSAFFNHRILELGARMPPEWKVDRRHGWQTKVLLKQAAQSMLPADLAREVVGSPKCGYGHSVDRMRLIRHEWREEIEGAIARNEPHFEEIMDPVKIRVLLQRFQTATMTPLEERRVLKTVLFLAWLDGQYFPAAT